MSRATFQAALAEIYGLLAEDEVGTPVATLRTAGVVKVYPHEPGATGVVKPCSVTISPSGIEPHDWLVTLRVYIDDQYPERAQDLLIDSPIAVTDLLLEYGPDRWAMSWEAEIGWVAACELMVGREDGF